MNLNVISWNSLIRRSILVCVQIQLPKWASLKWAVHFIQIGFLFDCVFCRRHTANIESKYYSNSTRTHTHKHTFYHSIEWIYIGPVFFASSVEMRFFSGEAHIFAAVSNRRVWFLRLRVWVCMNHKWHFCTIVFNSMCICAFTERHWRPFRSAQHTTTPRKPQVLHTLMPFLFPYKIILSIAFFCRCLLCLRPWLLLSCFLSRSLQLQ